MRQQVSVAYVCDDLVCIGGRNDCREGPLLELFGVYLDLFVRVSSKKMLPFSGLVSFPFEMMCCCLVITTYLDHFEGKFRKLEMSRGDSDLGVR